MASYFIATISSLERKVISSSVIGSLTFSKSCLKNLLLPYQLCIKAYSVWYKWFENQNFQKEKRGAQVHQMYLWSMSMEFLYPICKAKDVPPTSTNPSNSDLRKNLEKHFVFSSN